MIHYHADDDKFLFSQQRVEKYDFSELRDEWAMTSVGKEYVISCHLTCILWAKDENRLRDLPVFSKSTLQPFAFSVLVLECLFIQHCFASGNIFSMGAIFCLRHCPLASTKWENLLICDAICINIARLASANQSSFREALRISCVGSFNDFVNLAVLWDISRDKGTH